MTGLDEEVRSSLRAYANTVDSASGGMDDVVRRARRSTRRRRSIVSIGAAAAVIAAIAGVMATRETRRTLEPAGVGVSESNAPDTKPDGSLASTLVGSRELLPSSPLSGRNGPAYVWTGTHLLIWGGAAGQTVVDRATVGEITFADGASYDPVSRVWELLPVAPIEGRTLPASVWTGSEMLVWGGGDNGNSQSDGAAYDPSTKTWRVLSAHSLSHTIRPAAVWTGTEMVVLEGVNGGPSGAAYNPATDTWRTIATPPGRSIAPYPHMVWTGDRLIAELGGGPLDQPIIAVYDPTADSWQTIESTRIPSNYAPALVWTGSELFELGPADTSHAWNPTSRVWRPLASPDAGKLRSTELPLWTGDAVLFWTGDELTATYFPSTDSWRYLSGGALSPRADGAVVWADGELLAWGGFASSPGGTEIGSAKGLAWRPDLQAAEATLPPDQAFQLYTHCGVNGAMLDGRWWAVTPALTDGSANPPAGWGNPFQLGTMHFVDHDTVVFTGDDAALTATLHRTAGADFPVLCK